MVSVSNLNKVRRPLLLGMTLQTITIFGRVLCQFPVEINRLFLNCVIISQTGDMEVKNPLFNEEPTPATPGKIEVVKPQPKE